MNHQGVTRGKVIAGGLFIFSAAGLVLHIPSAQASLKDMKIYREAFPDSKLKCIDCHVNEKPSKEDGKGDLNDYGKAVVAVDPAATADAYKKVGKIEDFKKP